MFGLDFNLGMVAKRHYSNWYPYAWGICARDNLSLIIWSIRHIIWLFVRVDNFYLRGLAYQWARMQPIESKSSTSAWPDLQAVAPAVENRRGTPNMTRWNLLWNHGPRASSFVHLYRKSVSHGIQCWFKIPWQDNSDISYSSRCGT